MLIKQIHLKGIKENRISLSFRKWKKPMVKKGSLIKTSIGQVEIIDINVIEKGNINNKDAAKAGHKDLAELLAILDSKQDGIIFKINLAYHSPDPRIQLREQKKLSIEEYKKIFLKLRRMDNYSKQGEWTLSVLKAIKNNPSLRAQDLADKIGVKKEWLKPNIRKLKNLGLTISHKVGYSISPMGIIFLDKLNINEDRIKN